MVVVNPTSHPQPSWQEIDRFICDNGIGTLSGEALAPRYEYRDTGERVRMLTHKDMESKFSLVSIASRRRPPSSSRSVRSAGNL